MAAARSWLTCLHERQASRLARSLGVKTIHLVELLFDGAPAGAWLEPRVRHFTRLTNLAMDDLDQVLRSIEKVW